MSRVAIIGLGEAGVIYAEAFRDAGHDVVASDPAVSSAPQGVTLVGDAAEAASAADAVLVLTGAAAAAAVASACLPVMRAGSVYVDMTSSAPDAERVIAAQPSEATFADVAILGPVIAQRAATPLMVSGPGSRAAAELLTGIGAPVTDIGGEPGDAVARKLVRSVLAKGFAAIVCEAVEAGQAAGFEDWVRAEAARLLPGGAATVDRYLSGTRKHARRRGQEMVDSAAFLAGLGVPNALAEATARTHLRLAEEEGAS